MESLTLLVILSSFLYSTNSHSTVRRTFGEEAESPGRILDDIRSSLQDEEACPGCSQQQLEARLTKEELDKHRIEMIKAKILKELRMDRPPNITKPMDALPEPITLEEDYVYRDERETDETEASEFYVFPEAVEDSCLTVMERPMVCFHFHFDTKIRHYRLHQAEFWVYKLRDVGDDSRGNQTLLIREISNPRDNSRKTGQPLARLTTTIKAGWVKFDLKGAVYRYLRSTRHRTKGIEIICETCRGPADASPVGFAAQHKPFFKLVMERKHQRRSKRSVQCGGTITGCCVESLYVDFQVIGWHWIRNPQGYYSNYCRGSCTEVIGTTGRLGGSSGHDWHVARVLGQVRAHTQNDEMRGHLSSCCAPNSASPLNLLYFDTDAGINMVKKTLPNMIINSCGCL